jgi:hypothetical protein
MASVWVAVGLLNVALGLAYTNYGFITIADMKRGWKTMGFSHFGAAWIAMAFTCGPHHLVHGVHILFHGRAEGPLDLLAVLVGLPAGVAFLSLRVEAVLGGRGDRFISGSPVWVKALPTAAAVYGTALLMAVLPLHGSFRYPRQITPNLMLIVLYFAIGYFLLRTQLRNRPRVHGWSVSGLALTIVFPTCGLMHGVYAYYASTGVYRDIDWHGWVIDWLAVPAAIYFLMVVRGLYRQSLHDWNRRMVDNVPDRSAAAVVSVS